MKTTKLLMALLLAASASTQANAVSYISQVGASLDLSTMTAGSSQQVLIYVDGGDTEGATTGYLTYTEVNSNNRFYINSSAAVDGEISNYIFTLTKTSDGYYTIMQNANSVYIPVFTSGASGPFSGVALNATNYGSFTATVADETVQSYTLTNSASNGCVVTQSGSILQVATSIPANFQFRTFEGLTNFESLSRSDWSVSACTQCTGATAGADGTAAMIIDDNLSTFWHNNWDSCPSSDHYNWFLIDCGEEVEFDVFSYTSRPSSTNGVYGSYAMYVSSDPITATNDGVTAYMADNAATSTGTLPRTASTTTCVKLGDTVTGRYILMVKTGSDDKWGTCADFQVYISQRTLLDAYKQDYIDIFNSFNAAMLPTAVQSVSDVTYDAALTLAENKTAVDNATAACWNQLANQTLYIKNVSRENAPYLTAHVNDTETTNSLAYPSWRAKWQLKQTAVGSQYYRLYNLATQSYFCSSDKSTVTTDADDAVQITFAKTANGVAMRFTQSTLGISMDNAGSAPSESDCGSEGASWAFEVVAVPAPELADGKYYRIRSNRAYFNQSAGSIMKVAGVQATSIDNDLASMTLDESDAGSVWSLETVDANGGFHINSLIADYDPEGHYGLNSPSRAQISTNATPATYYLLPMSVYSLSFTETYPNGIALSSTSDGSGNQSCVDVSGSGIPKGLEWKPGRDGTASNSGTIFYFEEVCEDELNEITAKYLATLSSLSILSATDNTALTTMNTLHNNVPVLFPEAIDYTAETADCSQCASVADGVALYRTAQPDQEHFRSQRDAFYAQAANKEIRLYCADQSRYLAVSDGAINVASEQSDMSNIWTLQLAEIEDPFSSQRSDVGLYYYLKSKSSGLYLGYSTFVNGQKPPMVDNASSAHAVGLMTTGENQFRITYGTRDTYDGTANKDCICIENNSQVKVWGDGVARTILTASSVDYTTVEYPEELETSLAFPNVAVNNYRSSDLHITLTPAATANSVSAMRRIEAQSDGSYILDDYVTTEDDGTLVVSIPTDNSITSGNYILTVPAGYFVDADNNLSAEFSAPFIIGESGALTSIEEIGAETVDAAFCCYDMTGRRIASPVKGGIYIVNGKKVRF